MRLDPRVEYVIVDATTSAPVNHPDATAILPPGFVLVGGGARANWEQTEGPGSLLWASRPAAGQGWYAAAKDHVHPSPSTVTAFAIGVTRSFLASRGLTVVRFHGDSRSVVPHPGVDCGAEDGPALVGGGAETHWRGAGSLLTASVPANRQARLPARTCGRSREGPPASRSVHHLRLGLALISAARLKSGRRKPRRRGLAQNQAIGSISAH